MNKNSFLSKIVSKKFLNKDTIYLKLEKPTDYVFKPGQFLQIFFSDIKRSYSICSKPSADTIDLCIKLLPEGKASKLFEEMTENQVLEISSALGHFVLNEEDSKKVFVATGSGLAPMMSMIKTALEDYKHNSPMHLLFGLRNEENLFWQDELEKLAKDYTNFSFDITLSQPSSDWKKTQGRVTAHIAHLLDKSTSYYLCGSPDMVKDVRKLLIDNEIAMKNIKFEIF